MNGEMTDFGWLPMIVWAALVIIPFWKICQKAGYPGVLGLLIIVPLVNLVFLYYLGFATWPIQKSGEEQPPGGTT